MYNSLKSKIKSRQFAVVRRRYSLPEVPWRRIHNVIAYAMSICVAFSNKVMDTRRPQPVGCGGKYDVDRGQSGRSMIEMLGVLAIIAVLSVGGIAGYSKAMQKYKINAAIENHRNIIMSLLQQAPNISRANTNVNLNNIVYALELIPQSWDVHFAGQHDAYLNDDLGNGVVSSYYSDRDAMLYSIALNSENETSVNDINYQFCLNYITNIIQPLSDVVIQFSLYRYTVSNDVYYGKNNCSPNRNCLSQITLSDITNKCKICNTKIGNNTCKLNLLLRF